MGTWFVTEGGCKYICKDMGWMWMENGPDSEIIKFSKIIKCRKNVQRERNVHFQHNQLKTPSHATPCMLWGVKFTHTTRDASSINVALILLPLPQGIPNGSFCFFYGEQYSSPLPKIVMLSTCTTSPTQDPSTWSARTQHVTHLWWAPHWSPSSL